jgi:hypothetical protein
MNPQSDDNASRTILPWLLVFLYFPFLYYFGAKLSSLTYVDYPSFYSAAQLTFREGRSPYDPNVLSDAAGKSLAGRESPLSAASAVPGETPTNQRIYPYLYPPPSLLLFYPLSHVSYDMGKVAVLVLNHACLLLVAYVFLVKILGFAPRQVLCEVLPAALALYIIYSRGVSSTIELGQVNLLVLALLCGAWWAWKYDRPDWMMALPLALACVFKIYPVLFIALLVMRRKFVAAGMVVALLLLAGGLSWVLLPHALWHDWLANVAPSCGYLRSPMGRIPPTLGTNVGIAGFVARLFLPPLVRMEDPRIGPALFPHPAIGRALAYFLVMMVTVATLWAAYRSTRRGEKLTVRGLARVDVEFSAFLVLTFLVAPLAWEHHLVYVVPAVVVAILLALRGGGASSRSVAVILAAACVIGWPLAIAKLPLPRLPQVLLVSIKLYAVLVVWAFLLIRLWRSSKEIDRANPASMQQMAVG